MLQSRTVQAPESVAPERQDPSHLLEGMTDGARLSPDTLFSTGSNLVIDASHVQVVKHEGLSVVPIDEVFGDSDAVFLGFGFPNVYLAMPRAGDSGAVPGWDRLAAFMFFRQAAFVADTKGRVQGGMLVELRGLPPVAKAQLREAAQTVVGKRHISCANAIGQALTAAGFTCGGKALSRKVRPSRLARTIWERGLEFGGEVVEIRLIRTEGRTVSDHFAGVSRKEFTSGCRAAKKILTKKFSKAKSGAPVIEPRTMAQAVDSLPRPHHGGPTRELFVGRPSRLASVLRRTWGDHPIFEVDTRGAGPFVDDYSLLTGALQAYPGDLDFVSRAKRYLLFSKPVVRVIRQNMAVEMESLGEFPGPALADMLQVGCADEPFIYNVVLTGTSFRISRLENRTEKDIEKANWVLAKHVLLSGYDPDVRFAGEMWAQDTDDGRIMHLNNNSGTYQPTAEQTNMANEYLSELFDVPVTIHIVE